MNTTKKILVVLLLTLSAKTVFSQHAVGLSLDLNNDLVEIGGEGDLIVKSPRLNTSGGIAYRYTFKNGLNLQGGIGLKDYVDALSIRGFGETRSNGNMVAQLRLSVGKNFYTSNRKFFVSPLAGITCNSSLFYTPSQDIGPGSGRAKDTLIYYSSKNNYHSEFFTAHLGLELGYNLTKHFTVCLSARYNMGFIPVSRDFITYRLNSNPVVTATQTSKGNYLTFLSAHLYYNFVKKDL